MLMNKIIIITSALGIMFFIDSCINSGKKNSNKEETKLEQKIPDYEYTPKNYIDKTYIKSFKLSSCEEHCKDPGKVYRNEYIKGKLYLKFGHWFNCSLSESYSVSLSPSSNGDILNFHIRNTGPDVECDCYFYCDCIITGLKKQPQKIMINNKEIDDYPSYIDLNNYEISAEEEAVEEDY